MQNTILKNWSGPFLMSVLFIILTLKMEWTASWFRAVFPDLNEVMYDRAPFSRLVWQHMSMVGVSSLFAILIGVSLGVWATRGMGRDFLPIINSTASLGQTFPPVAVLALAVPAVGFGYKPTLIALVLYGILPIIRNTISGLEGVNRGILEAAKGMGMTWWQILFKVELPLAMKVIVAGVRTSTIINIGTATIGATIGAGGLGAPIIAGLINENSAYVLQGALLVGLMAVIVDQLLEKVEQSF